VIVHDPAFALLSVQFVLKEDAGEIVQA